MLRIRAISSQAGHFRCNRPSCSADAMMDDTPDDGWMPQLQGLEDKMGTLVNSQHVEVEQHSGPVVRDVPLTSRAQGDKLRCGSQRVICSCCLAVNRARLLLLGIASADVSATFIIGEFAKEGREFVHPWLPTKLNGWKGACLSLV